MQINYSSYSNQKDFYAAITDLAARMTVHHSSNPASDRTLFALISHEHLFAENHVLVIPTHPTCSVDQSVSDVRCEIRYARIYS